MDNATISGLLWIVAGGMLTLYLLRRRQRKTEGK